MINFPLAWLLVPYCAVLLFVAVMVILNIGHLLRYGATTGTSFIITFVFLVGLAGIGFVTCRQLDGVDWTAPVELSMPAAQLPTWQGSSNQVQP